MMQTNHNVISYKTGRYHHLLNLVFIVLSTLSVSCRKMVEIKEPVNSITTMGAFSTDATAISTVAGIYSKMTNTDGTLAFGSGAMTLFVGLSSDELTKVGIGGGISLDDYYFNKLLPDNGSLASIWEPAYFTIYQANACLEGLDNSTTLTDAVKAQLIGESKFLRAFALFYLTNLWGDIPMPLTSNWNKTYLLPRASKGDVYQQIVEDLEHAQSLLKPDYSQTNGERIRPNSSTATALLARVYLYQNEWTKAENEATLVIDNASLYSLDSSLNNVFMKNSAEAIFQLQPSDNGYPWAVLEGSIIQEFPIYYLTDDMVNAFETGDHRKDIWTKVGFVSGTSVSQPFKYIVDYGNPGGPVLQNYVLLRLAEQYLIRAEARAQQDKLSEALADLNIIRSRAQLSPVGFSDKDSLLLAIEHERQVELFAEWGHRWFDLIRTDRASLVLGPIKGSNWQSTDQLYPIPLGEMQKNPNLTQNAGY